jgi:hypothetical protein
MKHEGSRSDSIKETARESIPPGMIGVTRASGSGIALQHLKLASSNHS